MDKHLSLPSLYGYRRAIGYFRVVKSGIEIFLRFPSKFGGHGLSLFLGLSSRSRLVLVGRPEGKTSASFPSKLLRRPGI